MIDVLRWSTVVTTALAHGATRVEAFATPDDARRRADALGRSNVVLGGERGSVALPGFDLGNSPAEYSAARVQGKVVVTTTTNGTQALQLAREGKEVLVAAFVNLPALLERLRPCVAAAEPIVLLCAGQAGDVAAEDMACAGAIAESLGAPPTPQWLAVGRDPHRACTEAAHGRSLIAAGFEADVVAASDLGRFTALGRLDVTGITLAREPLDPRLSGPDIAGAPNHA